MKDILIINLTRMGDLLQTTPLMSGLKEKYPDVKITLLVNSTFKGVCKGILYIDELIDFDMWGYRNRLCGSEHSLVENYKFLELLIDRIREKEYDLVFNLTHSPISSLLVSLVRAKEIRGCSVDSEGHSVIKHPWMRYFFNVVPNRNYNPFHLVDMYLKVGDVMPSKKGLTLNYSEEDKARAFELLRKKKISKDDITVGIHLGASTSEKRWSISSYAELARMIYSAYAARILLFGTAGEAHMAEEFLMSAGVPCISYVGETGIGELAAMLGRCSLFISNDTGPLHIATSAGTKVIDISVANVHFMETGPYGEGHYVIQADLPCVPCGFDVECNDMVCKNLVKPEVVFDVVKGVLEGEDLMKHSASHLWENVNVYKSYFKDDGYLDFSPLLKHSLRREVFYRILYRHIWNLNGDGADWNEDDTCKKIRQDISSRYNPESIQDVLHTASKEIDIIEQLVHHAVAGLEIVGHIAEEAGEEHMDIQRIQELGRSLSRVDREIELTGHGNPCLRPVLLIFQFSKEALEDMDLKVLAGDSHGIYNELKNRLTCLMRLLKRLASDRVSQEKEKPAAIHQRKIHA